MKKKKKSKLKFSQILGPDMDACEQTTSASSGSYEAPLFSGEIKENGIEYDEDPKNIPFNDGDNLEDFDTAPISPVTDFLPDEITDEEVVALLSSIDEMLPEIEPFIATIKAENTDEDGYLNKAGFLHNLLGYLDELGVVISPNWQVVPEPMLNENSEAMNYKIKTTEPRIKVRWKEVKRFLDDIEHYVPALMPDVRKFNIIAQRARINNHTPDFGAFLDYLIHQVSERGMEVSPSLRIVPNLELNEEDLDEQTTSSSSGSYETPGCWATGKGKDSIKNSRAVKSKLFRRNLYGGPGAKYVPINGSVNTLGESTDIYNENSSMKKNNIQKLVEDTIRKEVIKTLKEGVAEKKVIVKEDTFLKLVDTMISEEKSHPGLKAYKDAHKESGTVNKKHVKDSMKRTKDYNDVEGNDNPEFPHQVGGEKKARKNTPKQDEFIEDFRGSSMEDLTYDQEPDKEFQKRAYMSLVGDSIMGNPTGKDTANNIETEVGENVVKKAKRKKKKTEDKPMYMKDKQPTGKQSEEDDDKLEGEALKESVDTVLETEMAKIKKLYKYSDRTQ